MPAAPEGKTKGGGREMKKENSNSHLKQRKGGEKDTAIGLKGNSRIVPGGGWGGDETENTA
jgi:hypothetical protein